MHTADGCPDLPQVQTGNAGAVAATRVSNPQTQPWRIRRKHGSLPLRPGMVAAADLSPWTRARRLLSLSEAKAKGTNPAPQDSFGKARQAI